MWTCNSKRAFLKNQFGLDSKCKCWMNFPQTKGQNIVSANYHFVSSSANVVFPSNKTLYTSRLPQMKHTQTKNHERFYWAEWNNTDSSTRRCCKRYTEVYQLHCNLKPGIFSNKRHMQYKKGGWQNHGLNFQMLKGPTQSAFCNAKNWFSGQAKTLHVLICYSTDTFVICRMWEHKHYATFVLEKMLKKNSSVSMQMFAAEHWTHPRWFGLLRKLSRFYRCNNRCKSKIETTNPDVYTLYSDKKAILK